MKLRLDHVAPDVTWILPYQDEDPNKLLLQRFDSRLERSRSFNVGLAMQTGSGRIEERQYEVP
jgi:hypothetical protein